MTDDACARRVDLWHSSLMTSTTCGSSAALLAARASELAEVDELRLAAEAASVASKSHEEGQLVVRFGMGLSSDARPWSADTQCYHPGHGGACNSARAPDVHGQ
jgi:hypothetical protein